MRFIIFIIIILSPLLHSKDNNNIIEVELELFELSRVDSTLVIKWETATEFNNKYFFLERSLDHQKLEFEVIDTLEGALTSITNKKYTSIDSTVDFNNTYHYRLSTESLDGTIQVFNNLIVYTPEVETYVIESNNEHIIDYELFENRIIIKSPVQRLNQINIFSLEGKTVNPKVEILNDSYFSIDISELPSGKYLLLYYQNLICKFIK